jgi:hypothetical protein
MFINRDSFGADKKATPDSDMKINRPLPVHSFPTAPVALLAALLIQFTAPSTGATTTYHWIGGYTGANYSTWSNLRNGSEELLLAVAISHPQLGNETQTHHLEK